MKEYKGSPALDAGLLAAAQAVEHYGISRYGTLIAWAEELGLEDAVSLLQETLRGREDDGRNADRYRQDRRQSAGRGRLTLQMPRSGGAFFSGPMTPCIHGRGLPEHNRRGPLGRINPQFSPLSPSFFSRATASPSQVSALSGASAVLREICLRTTAHGIRRRASCSRKSSSLGPRCVPSTSEAPVDGSANRGLRAPTAQGVTLIWGRI